MLPPSWRRLIACNEHVVRYPGLDCKLVALLPEVHRFSGDVSISFVCRFVSCMLLGETFSRMKSINVYLQKVIKYDFNYRKLWKTIYTIFTIVLDLWMSEFIPLEVSLRELSDIDWQSNAILSPLTKQPIRHRLVSTTLERHKILFPQSSFLVTAALKRSRHRSL